MGGCCSCFKDTPPSPQNPAGVSEEHVPESSHQGSPPAVSGGLLNDMSRQTLASFFGDQTNTSLQTRDSTSTQKTVAGDDFKTGTSSMSEKLKESESNVQTALKLGSAKDYEIEFAKLRKAVILEEAEEENACSICFIEYDAEKENTKIFTSCDHNFHIECIHGWTNKTSFCPMCNNQDVAFKSPSD